MLSKVTLVPRGTNLRVVFTVIVLLVSSKKQYVNENKR